MMFEKGIAANLGAVKGRIAEAVEAAGRKPGSVELVAISKTNPAEAILAAIAAGQRVFGENRVQEVEAKWPAIREAHPDPVLESSAHQLEVALERLEKVTAYLAGLAIKGEIDIFLADATLYLEFFGIIAIAWQWLRQGLAAQSGLKRDPSEAEANFYEGKLFTMKYFINYELPKTMGLAERLMNADGLTVEMSDRLFSD